MYVALELSQERRYSADWSVVGEASVERRLVQMVDHDIDRMDDSAC